MRKFALVTVENYTKAIDFPNIEGESKESWRSLIREEIGTLWNSYQSKSAITQGSPCERLTSLIQGAKVMNEKNNDVPIEAILFIPGLYQEKQDYYLDILSQGLKNLEQFDIRERGSAKILGHTGKSFEVGTNATKTYKIIDIYEAHWSDIFCQEKLSTQKLLNKFISGCQLLAYWLFSKTWAVIPETPSLTLGLMIYFLLLTFWYLSILILVMVVLGENPNFFGFNLKSISPELPRQIGELGKNLGGLTPWISISLLLSLIEIDRAIDIAYFTKTYISMNQKSSELRAKVRQRILSLLQDLFNNYDRVTVVGYSFGVTIGTEVLADYRESRSIRYITLGGQLRILSHQAQWIKEEIQKLIENEQVAAWINYYSVEDWLGSDTWSSREINSPKFHSHPIDLKTDWLEKLLGKPHLHYLYCPNWIEVLI